LFGILTEGCCWSPPALQLDDGHKVIVARRSGAHAGVFCHSFSSHTDQTAFFTPFKWWSTLGSRRTGYFSAGFFGLAPI
jgi:hypothetical protein